MKQNIPFNKRPASESLESETVLHRLFEAQVRARPKAIAISDINGQLTYADLNSKANRVANRLRQLGVPLGSLVGMSLDRSQEIAVAALAILKAGAGYLPIDPKLPLQRLNFILQDSAVQILITDNQVMDLPKNIAVINLKNLDLSDESDTNLEIQYPNQQIAYVIYTSGSTGKPKGVAVTHHNVTCHIESTLALYDLDHRDSWSLFHSFAFDVSVWEFWGALLSGANLVIVPYETSRDPQALLALLQRERVTILNQTPSAFRGLMQAECSHPAPLTQHLRYVILAGEALDPGCLKKWAQWRGDNCPKIINMYGITETTIHITWRPITANDWDLKGKSPIGKVIPHLSLQELNPQMLPVEQGVQAELFVGGAGLAMGYLNRPGLTAQRFLPNAFSKQPGERLYRTGDIVQREGSEELLFLGRCDDQVKIHGYRVELGEIESAIYRSAEITGTVVIPREDQPGNNRLVAYVSAKDVSQDPLAPQNVALVRRIRKRLNELLPEYMVPSVFVTLTELPLNNSGKIDRVALPAPPSTRPELSTSYLAPQNEVQALTCQIWEHALGLDKIGINDNLFELGGHSLVGIKIITQIEKKFRVKLPLINFFKEPTSKAAAQVISRCLDAPHQQKIDRIPVKPRKGAIPLSYQQEAIWFLDQLSPNNLAYNFQMSIRLHGPLKVDLLKRSLEEIVSRHEILRTSFPTVDGLPIQKIHDTASFDLPVFDVTQHSDENRTALVEKLVAEELKNTFDFNTCPLIRWTLYKLGEHDHLLLQVEHHFVHDGWSVAVFFEELKVIYEALLKDEPSRLPALPIQYADFALWQREQFSGKKRKEKLAYFKALLAEQPPKIDLPFDFPRPKYPRFKGELIKIELNREIYSDIKNFCRREGVSLFMTMAAAYKTLLFRYTGIQDIALGSAFANRQIEETKNLMGMFVNPIVMRNDIADDPTFCQFLKRFRDQALKVQAHQDVPFGQIVSELQTDRDITHNAFVQLTFSFHDSPVPDLEFGGLNGDLVILGNKSAKFDLGVIVIPRGEQRIGRESREEEDVVSCLWTYNSELFKEETVTQLINCYHTLLGNLTNHGHQRLTQLPILTEPQIDTITQTWNQTDYTFKSPQCVHQAFEEKAAKYPMLTAVIHKDTSMSYRDLDEASNRLARKLQALGIGPETIVGVCVPRSVEMIVGILAIMKAGGVYLPMISSFPKERFAYLFKDAKISLFICDKHLAQKLPDTDITIAFLDDLIIASAQESYEPLRVTGLSPRNASFIIYSSGSTGRPKGSIIEHRSLMNILKVMDRDYGLKPNEATLQKAPLCFDVSIWEIFWPLISGAKLVLAPPEVSKDFQELIDIVHQHKITAFFAMPSLLKLLLEEPHLERLASLKTLIIGAEQAHPEVTARFFERLPNIALFNRYGPSEITVFSNQWQCLPDYKEPFVPIGPPISNLQCYVLDRKLNVLPIGVFGQLHISGMGLSRGYLDRPALTAAKFIPNPFSEKPGDRMYATGDLVKHLPCGAIVFKGRIDHQVKLRGHRIELGEIDTVLSDRPEIQTVLTHVREDVSGDQRLVAYIVMNPNEKVNFEPEPWEQTWRDYLFKKLPDYMVPSTFVVLESLPKNASGKIDRKRLPKPDQPQSIKAIEAPETTTQIEIAAIWKEALGLERVSMQDNFFRLGGHSILAIKIISQIRRKMGINIKIGSFFENPTLSSIAEKVAISLIVTSRQPESEAYDPQIFDVGSI